MPKEDIRVQTEDTGPVCKENITKNEETITIQQEVEKQTDADHCTTVKINQSTNGIIHEFHSRNF